MKTRIGILLGVLAALSAIAPCQAAEVVRFKTGFELTAASIRYEGEMVYLTLDGGSEIGFPRWALQEVQTSQYGPPIHTDSYGRNSVKSSVLLGANMRPLSSYMPPLDPQAKVLLKGTTKGADPRGVNVGFSMGQPQARFSDGPTGPVSNARVGVSIAQALAKRMAVDPTTGLPTARPKVVAPITLQGDK